MLERFVSTAYVIATLATVSYGGEPIRNLAKAKPSNTPSYSQSNAPATTLKEIVVSASSKEEIRMNKIARSNNSIRPWGGNGGVALREFDNMTPESQRLHGVKFTVYEFPSKLK